MDRWVSGLVNEWVSDKTRYSDASLLNNLHITFNPAHNISDVITCRANWACTRSTCFLPATRFRTRRSAWKSVPRVVPAKWRPAVAVYSPRGCVPWRPWISRLDVLYTRKIIICCSLYHIFMNSCLNNQRIFSRQVLLCVNFTLIFNSVVN